MNFKNVFFLFLFSFLSVHTLYSQEPSFKELVIDKYLDELELDVNQQKKFTSVLVKFKPLFDADSINTHDHNSLLKREGLEIYGILNKDQLSVYKKIKKIIEPDKIYRRKKIK